MNFSKALEHVRKGDPIRLPHWSPEAHIMIKVPDPSSDMTHPYLYVESKYGTLPWKMTNPELFSYEWELFKEE